MNTPASNSAWVELFPDEDYRFNFGIHAGDAAAFFAPTADHARLCAERRHWMDAEPEQYSAFQPEAAPLLEETLSLARQWHSLPPDFAPPSGTDATAHGQALGREWEPDFLLLKAADDGRFHLRGACVCFPSSWRLTEKIGRPLDFIHGPVPGLNDSLGQTIHGFLSRMRPGPAWCRANWGLSRAPELNHHPDRALPRLTPPLRPEEVFVRIEQQALVVLPESKGVLFGIRLLILPLPELMCVESARRGLLRALRTMPEPVAAYKGLAAARAGLAEMLERGGAE